MVVVDIDFFTFPDKSISSTITKITVSIPPADDASISSLGPAAAEVLTNNFHHQDGDAFFKNLTNLARWDSCSETTGEGLNCFAILKSVEDALRLIFSEERKTATESQVISKGWGRPVRNFRNLVGLHIQYSPQVSLLIGTESRRPHYMHAPLQTIYLSPEVPFINDDLDMFALGTASELLTGSPNWIEQNLEGDLNVIHNAMCSFVMELSEGLVMSVEAAKKICEIIGYGMWTEIYSQSAVRDEWTPKDTMLEELLVSFFE